jgi:hypothetical protein
MVFLLGAPILSARRDVGLRSSPLFRSERDHLNGQPASFVRSFVRVMQSIEHIIAITAARATATTRAPFNPSHGVTSSRTNGTVQSQIPKVRAIGARPVDGFTGRLRARLAVSPTPS